MPSFHSAQRSDLQSVRSVLFVPATRPDRVAKAIDSGTDAVVLDFEDSVTASQKAESRASLAILTEECGKANLPAVVRINALATEWGYEDLIASVRAGVDGILVTKVAAGSELLLAEGAMRAASIDPKSGDQLRPPMLIPTIENARGVVGLSDILRASDAVGGVQLGTASGGDLMLDLGATATAGRSELGYARGHTVAVARSCGHAVIWDGAFLDVGDVESLRRESEVAAAFGFTGKMAIHPSQIAGINESFNPTTAEVEKAERIVEAYRTSVGEHEGALLVDGYMVDEAIYKRALQTLARAANHSA